MSRASPEAELARLNAATAGLEPPFAAVDLEAMRANAAAMTRRAAGKPIRLASKSVRCRALISEILRRDVFRGVLAGGGTGSIEGTATEPAVTEIGAGSGLYHPALFDGTGPSPGALPRSSRCRWSAGRRRPRSPCWAAATWRPARPTRPGCRSPTCRRGLRLDRHEGAGEVQTPLAGPAAAGLRAGDRVWFRHAKAGELCERFNELHLIEGGAVTGAAATYRGEGRAFL